MNGHSPSGAFSGFAAAAGAGFFFDHGQSGTFSTIVWPQPRTSPSGIKSSARDLGRIPSRYPSKGHTDRPLPHLSSAATPRPSSGFSRLDFSVALAGPSAENGL